MSLFTLSWKNLVDKPLSAILSLLLFALGVGLIALVFLIEHQLDRQFRRNMAEVDLVIGAKGSPLQLVLSSLFHLDAPTGNISLEEAGAFLRPDHPLIERAIPLSLGDSHEGFRIVGTQPSILDHYGAGLSEGRVWEKPMEVVLGTAAARRLDYDLGDTFQSTHGLDDNEDLLHEDAGAFRVAGILEPTGTVIDQLILTAPESVWAVHGHEDGGAADYHAHDSIPLYEHTNEEITAILATFRARNVQTLNFPRLINENTNLLAANPSYEVSKLFAQLGQGERILRILGYVIVLVSSFSIFISLFQSLRDRRYELAIMRTLGASPGTLFLLILLEGLLLAFGGYLLGLALAHGGLEVGRMFTTDTYRFPFTGLDFLPGEAYLLLGALVIGALASILPAWQARNTDIHETLAEG